FHVRRFRVSAYKGIKSQSRFVWVASENEIILPPGGSEPRLLLSNRSQALHLNAPNGSALGVRSARLTYYLYSEPNC
ncbi:MAG: hypothetical protein U9O82_09635, partial [Thermodesulfobacteriota bacterium]|nr:hypothetical protein [Thermodesulfobacteriota bacterium]